MDTTENPLDERLPLGIIGKRRYSIDTCVLLDMWTGNRGAYPKDRFPGLWDSISSMIAEGRIIAHKEVFDELKDHENEEFQEWLKTASGQLSIETAAAFNRTSEIITNYLSNFKDGYRPAVSDGADPFVVGLALSEVLTVFTQEKKEAPSNLAQGAWPKIPNICDEYNVECVDIKKFMELEDIVLVNEPKTR